MGAASFLFVQCRAQTADVFKYSHSGGRRGRPVLTSSRIEIFCLIGFTGGVGRLWSRENKMWDCQPLSHGSHWLVRQCFIHQPAWLLPACLKARLRIKIDQTFIGSELSSCPPVRNKHQLVQGLRGRRDGRGTNREINESWCFSTRKPNNPLKYCRNTNERYLGKHFKLSYSHFYPDKFSCRAKKSDSIDLEILWYFIWMVWSEAQFVCKQLRVGNI